MIKEKLIVLNLKEESQNSVTLSLEAKGVLSTMLNNPETDYCTLNKLCEFFKSDSPQIIKKALSELTEAGYLICIKNQLYAVNKLKLPQMKVV